MSSGGEVVARLATLSDGCLGAGTDEGRGETR